MSGLLFGVVTRETTERGAFVRHGREVATISVESEWVTGLEAIVKEPL